MTMTTTTSKPHARTKTAGYKEGIGFIAEAFAEVSHPAALPTTLLVMVSDLFDRPVEKVLADVSSALLR